VKAAVRTEYGPPEAVRIVEVPSPVPGNGEVLVRVHATTVNRTDCGFRGAKPFFIRAFTAHPRSQTRHRVRPGATALAPAG
jgi:NADPH:quinone reductase-like Zn-dependent oxidoreductase